ncbi:heme oxygenase [Lysinibacillus sp. 54212]|uniref:heme oxygenase n=1 Tax=Lysinibacillus sp. 54212 TaxID=3119829 RepID=UPI002FC5E093
MITVTNRIQLKKGMGEKMAPMFAKPGPLQNYEGFQKVEVLVSTQFEDYDELSVMMYWDNEDAFEVWRSSDDFKNSHKRSSGGEPDPNSPVITSQIVIAKVAASIARSK